MDVIKLHIDTQKYETSQTDYTQLSVTSQDTTRQILALKKNGILVGGRQLSGWRNNGEDLHKSVVGEEVYEDKVKRQFQDATAKSSGFLDGLGARLAKTKMEFFHAQRLKHPNFDCCPRPVGGAGFAKVVSNPKCAAHSFFRAGRVFSSIRLRHNNLAFTDDAMLDARVACVKFKDADSGGDLDLILYTGRTPPYYNTASFHQYVESFGDGDDGLKTWLLGDPVNYIGRIESMRRNPNSYYDQHYYSHVTYLMTSQNGEQSLARLRLLPADDLEQSGLPEKYDQENAWNVNRWANDDIGHSYLRREYKTRLREAAIQYRLQIQTRPEETCDDESSNPCITWSDQMFPWTDIALLTITHPLKQKVLAKTQIDLLANPLPCFKPLEPQSMKDFRSLVFVLREFHGVTANSQSELKADKEKVNAVEVTITVRTGNVVNAGTDADIYITIIGSKLRTQPIYLDTPFHDDFEMGCTDVFNIAIPEVGTICAIKMELQSVISSRQWYLDDLVIESAHGEHARFPCYQWLTHAQPSILLRPATASLYQQEQFAYGILQRKLEIEQKRALYQWEKIEGLPGRIKCAKYDNLPREVKFMIEKERDLTTKYMRTLANSGLSAVTTLFDGDWDMMTDYDKILTHVLKDKKLVKRVAEVWKEDAEFGRQLLAGANPTQIRRVTKVTPEVEEVAAAVQDLLDWSQDLEAEMFAGRIFVMDFSVLNCVEKSRDYKGKYNRYITTPVCYLYSHHHGSLLPIAIKIPTDDGKELLFTPKDSESDWLAAKMWVREADAQVHQVVERHLKTQLTMEAFAMATYRNLPACHPVYKLLLPHLRYTIGINVLGRQHLYPSNEGLFEKLLAVGGQHMELLREAYSGFNVSDLHFPNFMSDQGLDDTTTLPDYHYRDDGLLLWKAINKFVRTIIHLYYNEPEVVRGDFELQSWVEDLRTNGFPSWPGDKTNAHGLPDCFHSQEILVEILTTVIFTATARHAALTLGMMDYYSFVPNMPAMLLGPPPQEKGVASRETIRAMLPSRGKTAEIIAACYTLSRFGKDEVFLGFYPEEYFDDDTMQAAFHAFKVELDRIATSIRHRNQRLDVPYTYLDPNVVPNSISM